jgi:NAD(P)-dependent dehydrogenase (short-subunit alcohol dehydrogenase family)
VSAVSTAAPPTGGPPRPVAERVALVSDGDRGLGPHLVRRLAELGMRVVLASRSAEQGRQVLDGLGPLADRVAVRELDVLDAGSVERLTAWLRGRLGRCDVFVNNATHRLPDDRDATDLDVVRRMLEANVVGTWRLIRAVAPIMRARRYGRVVTVSAGHGSAACGVINAALRSLTSELAEELAGRGILINACCVRHSVGRRSTPASTQMPLWLATLPDNGPTGRLYCQPTPAG